METSRDECGLERAWGFFVASAKKSARWPQAGFRWGWCTRLRRMQRAGCGLAWREGQRPGLSAWRVMTWLAREWLTVWLATMFSGCSPTGTAQCGLGLSARGCGAGAMGLSLVSESPM